MSSVSIASDNTNTSKAKAGDNVTLTFTASKSISTPTVTFASGGSPVNGNVTVQNTSGNTWTASFAARANSTDGPVTFSVSFNDTVGNAGTAVTATSDGTSVAIDNSAPTLSGVSIASDNTNTTKAQANDDITLTFTASEAIGTPVVTFRSGGDAITDGSVVYSNTSGNTWTAVYTANASDTDGAVTYSIAFSDTTGNAGTAVTSGSGSVTTDTTAPTLSNVSITSDNSTLHLAKANDDVTLTFTAF